MYSAKILIDKPTTANEIMKDFDEDKYTESFCKKEKCTACSGTDFNGEPNGYGCGPLDMRIGNMYKSILRRRLKKLGIAEKDLM